MQGPSVRETITAVQPIPHLPDALFQLLPSFSHLGLRQFACPELGLQDAQLPVAPFIGIEVVSQNVLPRVPVIAS